MSTFFGKFPLKMVKLNPKCINIIESWQELKLPTSRENVINKGVFG